EYERMERYSRYTWPKRTVVLFNRRRIMDETLSDSRRTESLELLEHLGGRSATAREELANLLTDPATPQQLKQAALRLLLKRDYPDLAVYVVKAMSNIRSDNSLREAILDWLTKHPTPTVLSEIVKLWAEERSVTSPDEPRYRIIVERISGTNWDRALLESLNTPEFFARGSALKVLVHRMPELLLRRQIMDMPPRTEAVTVMQTFLEGFDYLPTSAAELISAVSIYKNDYKKLAPAARLVRSWHDSYGYRFNIRDFYLVSRIAEDPLRPKFRRLQLVLELQKKLARRGHAHATRPGYEGIRRHEDNFMRQSDNLSAADLWNLYLLNEMLSRPRIQVALRIMARHDRADRRTAWGGLVFYENGRAEAKLYPASLKRGENDLLYRPSARATIDGRSALCRFHAHFEKVANDARIGPRELELAAAKRENFYGLVLTSLDKETFCAHYYNPDGAVVSLGKFPFRERP
ncbi:MAG: hypothetical protein KAU28_09365, partial [Phycisphaerae bacterium]|nr:hypothetical protein [Phycisphaerae bacterium]